jgi:rod shape-determining protein MreD
MTNAAGRFIPALSVAVLALVAVLPWGLPPDGRFVLPLLPFIAIHYWASRHPDRLAEWVPFVAGLAVDVLSNGPLGYWSLIYLVGYMIAVEAHLVTAAGPAGRWFIFLTSLALLVAAAWGIASLYYLELAAWRPFAWAALLAGLAYPVFALILRSLDPDPIRRSNDSLVRGG